MSFKAYWPRYLAAHSHPGVRKVHVVATGAALACAALGLVTRSRWLLLLAPGVAIVPARLSHHYFGEGAPDAETANPLYAALANVILLYKSLNGSIEEELECLRADRSAKERYGDTDTPAPNMVTDRTLH